MDVVLAVDIGGTKTACALVNRQGTIQERDSVATPAGEGPEAVIAAVARLARSVLRQGAAETPHRHVRAAGIGTAGVVDVQQGTIVSSTDTFYRWAGTPLRDRLSEELASVIGHQVPVHVQNDADAYGMGEVWKGAACGRDSALVVAVGTGVGAAVVIDGRPLRGAHHLAGEIAHVPTVGAEGLRCPCGVDGHLEAIASGVGLHAHYLRLGGDGKVVDAREVCRRAQAGDRTAVAAVSAAASALSRGIAAVVTVLDPAVVVVSGGLAAAGDLWWGTLQSTLRRELIPPLADLAVLPGRLGSDGPLVGAAAAAWTLADAS